LRVQKGKEANRGKKKSSSRASRHVEEKEGVPEDFSHLSVQDSEETTGWQAKTKKIEKMGDQQADVRSGPGWATRAAWIGQWEGIRDEEIG